MLFFITTRAINKLLLTGVLFVFGGLVDAQNTVSSVSNNGKAPWDWKSYSAQSQTSGSSSNSLLTASLTAQCTKMCQGNCQSMQLSVSGGTPPYTYNWSPNIGTGPGPYNMCPTSTTVYSFTVTDATGAMMGGGGCQMTIHPTYTNFSLNSVSAGCAGNNGVATTTVSGAQAPFVYNWSNGAGTSNVSNLSAGVYTVTVTDGNGCSKVGTTTVTGGGSPPVVTFTADDTSGCAPHCVNFNNTTPNTQNANWVFGDGGTGNTSSPNHCYTVAGVYSVSLTVTDNSGCTGSLVKNNYINVSGQPTAAITANPYTTNLYNSLIQFTDQSTGAMQWLWSFGDVNNSSSTLQNPSFTYNDIGTYHVVLVVTNADGCADTTDVTISILPDYALFAPNTFTPNEDNVNDIFLLSGVGIKEEGFEFYIYDRWGNMIFKSNKMSQGWNGKVNSGSDIAQQDVYVWRVRFNDEQGNNRKFTGRVNLIR